MENILNLKVSPKMGDSEQLGFVCELVYNAGYAGKNQEKVRGHIEELAALGVPAPKSTPTIYPLSNYLLTTSEKIQVQHGHTSGEVEYALLIQGDVTYVTIASDQTDRDLENYVVPASKQACPDVIAPEVWLYEDVKDHWDQIQLNCWVVKDGVKSLYQRDTLCALMSPTDWEPILNQLGVEKKNYAFLSGTINTLTGLVYGDSYEIEMTDPVLNRSIRHQYQVKVLPEGIE